MKNKLYFFLLTALMGLFGMNASAQDTYEITTAQDLANFAAAVNGGETTANAVLTTDIDMSELDSWTAIGDWNTGAVTSAYCGHFDGQGHTITNFNFTSNKNYFGIFGVVSTGCLIENFTIYGTMTLDHKTGGVVGYSRDATPTIRNIHSNLTIKSTADGNRPGGILGSAVNGTTVIENCTYSGTLNAGGHTGNIGGIVGYVNNNTAAIVNITNCLFDGKILNGTAEGQCGGIVGYNNKGVVTIKNCLSIGTIETMEGNDGMFFGRLNAGNSTFVNNYYVGANVNGTTSASTAKGTAPTKVTEAQLKSGEVCYDLNGDQSDIKWYQTLNDDNYPWPFNGGSHDQVYMNGRQHCDGTAYEGTSYSNDDLGMVTDEHSYTEGFCTYCGALDETWMTANGEGSFEIGTPIQLKWFAAYVNQVNASANAILTTDIDMGGSEWTPIGNSSVAFTGKFDGQGKAITGFSQTATTTHNGLFGNINGATVQNFSISGSLTSDKNYCGVIGLSKGSSKVKGIHSSLNLDIQFKGWAGGVVGGADGYIVIEECSFDGTLNTHNFEDSKGGILGYANAATIKNCLFSGTIVGEGKQHYGGILGYVNNGAFGGVQNCLSIGSVTTTNTSHNGVAAIVGNMNSSTKVDGVFNNYWLSGSSYAGNNGAKAPDAEAPVEVTAEQLASGEVTAKLGIAFRQNIGSDEAPVLDPTHNVVAKITEAGYATLFIPDTDLTIPAGIEANTGAILNEGWLHLNAIEGDAIAAGEPVVLKGNAGIYSFVPTTGAEKVAGNVLKGTAEDTAAAGKYVLAKPDGAEKAGFYLANNGTIKAGKAYLEVDAGVKAFFFDGDDATGIEETLSNSPLKGENVYNLAGQRMSKMHKGINIVDGKKILK